MNHQPEGVELVKDLRPANWVKERLGDWASGNGGRTEGKLVGSVIPAGFEAYVRVFHPAEHQKADGSWDHLKWSTLASWNGKVVHPQMSFSRIANLDPWLNETPSWGQAPFFGTLPLDECRALVSILKGFTATAECCYFCLWHGYGFLDDRYFKRVAKLKIPGGEEYLVFRGPLDSVMSFYTHVDGIWGRSPNIWWPEDRAWCVATDIDSIDTHVGGNKTCIEQALDNPELEALPIALGARIDYLADSVNV